jgi:diacylglycerol kinase (ATP)
MSRKLTPTPDSIILTQTPSPCRTRREAQPADAVRWGPPDASRLRRAPDHASTGTSALLQSGIMSPENRESPKRASSRIDSFRHAFAGVAYVIRTQRNTWIYGIVSACVLALGLWLQLSRIEWAVLFLTVGFVWVSEFINTALEKIVDLASPDLHPLAKIGKDVAAAAVLVGALTSLLVGLAILGPPLWARLTAAA